MSSLAEQCCQCGRLKKGETLPLLSDEQVEKHLASICPSWKLTVREDGVNSIRRTFVAKNFKAALAAIADYGEIIEKPDAFHHPDLHITSYRNVSVEYYTFSSGGLTLDDFIMAAKLDAVPVTYSPKFLRENPTLKAGVTKE